MSQSTNVKFGDIPHSQTKKKIGALEQIEEGLSKLDMAKDCCEEDRPQNALLLALQKMSGFNVCNSLGNNEGAWRTIET